MTVPAPRGLSLIQDDPGPKIRVQIIPDPYDRDRVDALYRESVAAGERLLVYTEGQVGSRFEMGMFGDFAPSVIYAINRHHGASLPYRESHLREFAFSKLCHLYCTLLKSLMFGFGTPEAAQSKLRGLRSIASILRQPELALPVSPVAVEEVRETFAQVLLSAARLLDEVSIPPGTEFDTRAAEPHALGYPARLRELFGDGLRAILLYGSSATGEGADYDNIVVVERIDRDLLAKLQDVRIHEGSKEVGIILVEQRRARQFFYLNVSNTLFRKSARILYGEVSLPLEGEPYSIRKEMYHAGFGSSKLAAALDLVYRKPEVLLDKAGLFDYFMKLNRFTFHGLHQIDGYASIPKATIYQALSARYGFTVPEFRPDADYIRESMLAANACSALIAQRLYSPRKVKGRHEVLLKLLRVGQGGIAEAALDELTVYVFPGVERLSVGQVVPVRILEADSPERPRRLRRLRQEHGGLPQEFELGDRV